MSRASLAERLSRYNRRLRAGHPPVVSEGDSWFDYPLFLNLIDRIDDEGFFAHMRLERSGDTVEGMIGSAARIRALADVVTEEQPVCVFFSGGGNDLADAADRLFRPGNFGNPADHLVKQEFDALLARIDDAYRSMVEAIGPVAPIFAHGYDYFQPSAKGVKFIVIGGITGPWIQPEMTKVGITDAGVQRAIARVLIDRFNTLLADIEKAFPLDFVHVDLRGRLSVENDWQNEIHPTRKGFQKAAAAFLKVVRQRLPGLQIERTRRLLA